MRELSLHVLDLARNSIEAGAARIELTIVEDVPGDLLEIVLSDDGRGMDPQTLARALDAFYTTRTTRRWGLGLPLLKACCECCEGGLEIASTPGCGTRVRGALRLSHLDRPPLGDMGAVVQVLACEAATVALRYRHCVRPAAGGERSFQIDTAELATELGDIEISQPTVLYWLREYVKGQLRAVGSVA